MRVIATVALSAAVLSSGPGCASSGAPSVLGRNLEVKLEGQRRARGELLAVEDRQLVLRAQAGPERVPLAAVREIQVRRHDWNGKRGLIWSAIGGLVSGTALAAACARESSSGCTGVGAVTFALWMGIGGLSSISMESASRHTLERPTEADLRSLARFPQGLPPGFEVAPLATLRKPLPQERPPNGSSGTSRKRVAPDLWP